MNNVHVSVSDLLDELELQVFRQFVVAFADAKYVGDNVLSGIAHGPQVPHNFVGPVKIRFGAQGKHVLDEQRMWFVADFEHVFRTDILKPFVG